MPDMPNRAKFHRASDGMLMSDTFRQQQQRRPSQMRPSVVEQDIYWKPNEGNLIPLCKEITLKV
jgi:hypothetical protein